jgi:protein-tyrosine phosphatase
LFGGFPCQEWLEKLFETGVVAFIDLTAETEKTDKCLPVYRERLPPSVAYISYPITDNSVPEDWQGFRAFIRSVRDLVVGLGEKEKVYIHCKGGHGRSGMVVACLLCELTGMPPDTALRETTEAHAVRKNLRLKWKTLRCPQNYRQRKVVMDLFGYTVSRRIPVMILNDSREPV